jgi:hypothetical protein
MIWAKAAFIVIALAAALWWHQTQVDSAADAAQLGERLVWQERQARANIEADRDRQETQKLIKGVEADYWRKQAESDARHQTEMTALEETIKDEKPSDATCGDFVSKRLRDQLNAIGRDDPPRGHP